MLKRTVIRPTLALALLSLGLAACNFAIQTPTPTLEPSSTPAPTLTATASATPSITPTPTTPATPTPSATPTITPTPSVTLLPSATPYPSVGFANDQWRNVDVPDDLRDGLDTPWFALVLVNERTDTTNLQTPIPASEMETVYLINPANGEARPVIELPASTGTRIYWAPDGNKLAYFVEPALQADGTLVGGVYLLNLSVGISLRLFDIPGLNPRGLPDHAPVWSPDSSTLAIALPTGYDVDIFTVSADGSVFQNLTAHGAYDFWPAWSPDGRRLAFVSDRRDCPTWTPGEPDTCAGPDAVAPTGGQLYVMDVETGTVRMVSEQALDGPPVWVSNLQVTYTTGLSDLQAGESQVWLANIQSGTVREVTGDEAALNLGAAWAPGGLQVLYHRASEPAAIELRDANGNLIVSTDQFAFARFGFAADWSPEGDYVVFGGRNGQCPQGLIVARNDLTVVYGPTNFPRACEPSYSPGGRWLAYAGITVRPGVDDGRLDLFVAQRNGYGGTNLTARLRGEIRLLGWVGPPAS